METFDLIVIGSGAAASSAWTYATSIGKTVAVCEKDTLGGECPTFACVPTKALLQSAEALDDARRADVFGLNSLSPAFDYAEVRRRKDLVVSRTGAARGQAPYDDAGVLVFRGHARFVSEDVVETGGHRLQAERFLIATGSVPRVSDIPGLSGAGFMTFREAIDLDALPGRMLIIGGGPVGCEFAQLFSSFGSRVHLVDHNARLLKNEDSEVGELLANLFRQRGVDVWLDANVIEISARAGGKTATIDSRGHRESVDVDEILVAAGKAPDLDLGLTEARIDFDEHGITADQYLATTNPLVYAAGDCVGPYRFTHAASYQGRIAAANAFEATKTIANYAGMPRCVFTSPEVAAAGMTEEEAARAGIAHRTAVAEIRGLGRANTSEAFDGFVKVLTDDQGTLLGAAIVAPRAGELVHELALAIRARLSAEVVADVIHAFPTFSEAVGEACAQLASRDESGNYHNRLCPGACLG